MLRIFFPISVNASGQTFTVTLENCNNDFLFNNLKEIFGTSTLNYICLIG